MELIIQLCKIPDINFADGCSWCHQIGEYTDTEPADWTSLMWATEGLHTEIVKILLKHPQIDVNKGDIYGWNALFSAIDRSHLPIMKLLLERPDINVNQLIVNQADKGGWTPLHIACERGRLEVVELLCEHPKINVNVGGQMTNGLWTKSPLYLASSEGNSAVVRLLLEFPQIDVNKMYQEKTPLWIASDEGHREVVDLLLQHIEIDVFKGISVNQNQELEIGKLVFDNYNLSSNQELLVNSITGNLTKILELLQNNETDINFVDVGGTTSLMWATKNEHVHLVRFYLAQSNIDVNMKRKADGATALMVASYNGYSAIVGILLNQKKIDINTRSTTNGDNAMMMASLNGHAEVLSQLIATNKIGINEVNSNGETSLYKAAQQGHLTVLNWLLREPYIDVNKANVDRVTPLMVSSGRGHFDIVEILLLHPNTVTNFVAFSGRTALLYSLTERTLDDENGLKNLVELFLRCPSIDIYHRDENSMDALYYTITRGFTDMQNSFQPRELASLQKSGHTCCSDTVNDGLQIAAGQSDLKMVEAFLICPQVHLNDGYKYGKTPLYIASEANHTEVVTILLNDQRTDVNTIVNSENALIKASKEGHVMILELLLGHPGIDVNKINFRNKKTALIVAAELGILDAVMSLLHHPQTFVNNLDSHSESALQKAATAGHLEVFKLLLRCPKTYIPKEVDSMDFEIQTAFDNRNDILKKGATCCLNVSTGLFEAAWVDDYRAIRGLLQCPNAEINTPNEREKTLIYIASWQGWMKSVQVLVNNSKLDINIGRTTDGSTAFSRASEKGHLDIMQILIDHKDTDMSLGWCKDNWAQYKILCTSNAPQNKTAAHQGNQNICYTFSNESKKEEFLSAAATGDAKNIGGFLRTNETHVDLAPCDSTNALFLASEYGHAEIIRMLLNYAPIRINEVDTNTKTCIYLASQNGHLEVVETLLQQTGIDVNIAESLVGETPLYVASKMGHRNITRSLLEKSEIQVNKYTIDRNTALMVATDGGYLEIVGLLMAHPKINTNFVNFEGKSAIMHSITEATDSEEKQVNIFELFIRCPSIDMDLRDELGNNVQDYVMASNTSKFQLALDSMNALRESGHTCCSRDVNDGLQISAEDGDLSMVRSFLQCNDVDLNDNYKYEITPLFMASTQNHINVVELLLADPRIHVNKVVNSKHALLAAAERGYTGIVHLLLQHPEIDVNKMNTINRMTALILGAELGFTDIVTLLLKHPQVHVNIKDSYAETAIQKAIHEGHTDVLKLILRCTKTTVPEEILSNKTEILQALDTRDDLLQMGHTCCLNVTTGLLSAALSGDFRALEGLLQCPDADINTVDDKGRTSIYLASQMGRLEALEVLLSNPKLDVNKGRIRDGSTAYSVASEQGQFIVMAKLVNHTETDVNRGWEIDNWASYKMHRKERKTPGKLHIPKNTTTYSHLNEELVSAARAGNTSKVQSLLAHGIDINWGDGEGRTALFEACNNGHLKVVLLLLNQPTIDLNKPEPEFGETPLHVASQKGHSQIVESLISMNTIDVNRSSKNRTTPLMVSSAGGHFEIVEMLLAHANIDANYATFKGQTSIFHSIIESDGPLELLGKIVNLHLRCPSVIVNQVDEHENTAKDYAGSRNFTDIAEDFSSRLTLMKNGHTCCSNQVNYGLQIAAGNGNLKMAKAFLMCSQVDLNYGYKFGATPLYESAKNNHETVVEMLLNDSRTDVNIEVNGKNAIYIASESGNTEIVRLFLAHSDVDINQINKINKMSALMIATVEGHGDIIKALLQHPQTDVGILDNVAQSVIEIASMRGFLRAFKLLLRCSKVQLSSLSQQDHLHHGPDITNAFNLWPLLLNLEPTCCKSIKASLLEAARIGDFRAIRGLLLCPDANINSVDKQGRTPLYLASWLGHISTVDVLLNNSKIDVNMGTNLDGGTPFSIAAIKGHFQIMAMLIGHEEMKEGQGWDSDSWAFPYTKDNFQQNATTHDSNNTHRPPTTMSETGIHIQ